MCLGHDQLLLGRVKETEPETYSPFHYLAFDRDAVKQLVASRASSTSYTKQLLEGRAVGLCSPIFPTYLYGYKKTLKKTEVKLPDKENALCPRGWERVSV